MLAKDFEIIKMIGKGASGHVYLCNFIGTTVHYAIKVIHKCDKREKKIYAERNAYIKLTHGIYKPLFVPKLFAAFQTDSCIGFVLQYIHGDTLKNVISSQTLNNEQQITIFSQITLALKYLHENNISHRDLKSENIMVTSDDDISKRIIKIVDFGFSTENEIGSENIGTPLYTAPEVILNSRNTYNSKKTDIWSLGIIFYELLTAELPFDAKNYSTFIDVIRHYDLIYNRKDVMNKMWEAKWDKHHIPIDQKEFLIYILNPNPTARPSIEDLMDNPIFNIKWEELENKCNSNNNAYLIEQFLSREKIGEMNKDIVVKNLEQIMQSWHKKHYKDFNYKI